MAVKKDIVLVLEFDDKGSVKVRKVVSKVKGELGKLGKSAKDTSTGFKRMQDQVDKSGKSMSKFKGFMKSTAIQMAAGMGVMMGVQGAMRLVSKAISSTMQAGREFEKTWANVTTMLTVSEEETKNLRTELLHLSPTLGDTTELARGMYQVLSASIEPAKAIKFLGEAAKSAKAGVTEVATSVDALTTVINAYGLQAEDVTEVSDIMFQTVKRGKLTYEGLSGALGTVVPIAGQIGVSFKEISAAMATLTRQGININTATVQLRQVMVSVLKPTEQAKTMAAKLGLEFTAAALKAKGFAGFLADIQEKTKGDAVAMTQLFGNVRALTGVLALAGKASAGFVEDLGLMETASGATETAFRKQMKSADFWMNVMKNTLKKLQIAFYGGLVEPAMKGVKSSGDLEKKTEGLIKTFENLGTAIGTVVAGMKSLTKKYDDNKELLKVLLVYVQGANLAMEKGQIPTINNAIKAWAEYENKITAHNKAIEKAKQPYPGFMAAIVQTAVNHREHIRVLLETAETGDKSREMIDAYLASLKRLRSGIDRVIDPSFALAKIFEELGIKTKLQLSVELDVLLKRFNLIRNSGRATESIIKLLAQKVVQLAENAGRELDPSIMKLAEKVEKVKKEMTGWSYIIALVTKAAAVMKEKVSLLGLEFAPELTTKLKKAEEAYAEFMAKGLLTGAQQVTAVESIIDLYLRQGKAMLEIPPRYLIISAMSKRTTAKVIADTEKLTKTQKKAWEEMVKRFSTGFSGMSAVFHTLADDYEGTMGQLLSATGSALDAVGTYFDNLEEGANASFKGIMGAIAPMLGMIGGAIGKMISGAKKSFAGLGASLGGMAGKMIGGPIGKAIGSLLGGIIGGLFKKKKTAEEKLKEAADRAAKEMELRVANITKILSKYGEISESTAKAIAEDAKNMKGFAAVAKHFGDVIRDVGITQKNVNVLWARTTDIIHQTTDGFLSMEDGISALNDSFTQLLEGSKKLGKEGSAEMVKFILTVRESGLEVVSVTDYVMAQLDKIPSALATMVKNAKKKGFDKLGAIAKLTFDAMIAEGRSYMETMEALKDPLAALIEKYKEAGRDLPGYLQPIADLMDLMELKPAVFENLDSALTIMNSLRNSAYLTQDAFNALSQSATQFARAILDVKGNLNAALKSMDLTQAQIQQLLPIVAQFVGAAAIFGLTIPAWMKTFVTQQLGVDWESFKDIVKTQAGAGITTVEKLKTLIETALPHQTESLRNKFDHVGGYLWGKLEHARRDIYSALGGVVDAVKNIPGGATEGGREGPPTIEAQGGWEGMVTRPIQRFEAHRGEHVKVTPAGEEHITVYIEPIVIPKEDEYIIEFIQKKIEKGGIRIPLGAVGG